jgi:hypothetical protein
MSKAWPPKDPDEVLDYDINWAPRLVSGDTIASSTFSVPVGDVVIYDGTPFTATATKVWLSGGTANTECRVNNRVVTAEGRTMDQTVKLRIQER